ncbi:hypothetical protein ANN_21701 [Periplaneta americana]|uniref:HTH CENPB-type domain-containing protein n=1 Tax=Periplaneta americana TaxID=6978 RepID=A0ABQ8S792_PERAM|nr:hypothetical protein ANN_21701 [Periplaneta americana]
MNVFKRLDEGETISAIPRSKIYDWKRNRAALEEYCASTSSDDKRRALKQPSVVKYDKELFLWFQEQRRKGTPISGPILKEKALDMHKKYGGDNFSASDGWLSMWREKYDVRPLAICRERMSANTVAAEEYKTTFRDLQLQLRIEHDGVWHFGGVNLCYTDLGRGQGFQSPGSHVCTGIRQRATSRAIDVAQSADSLGCCSGAAFGLGLDPPLDFGFFRDADITDVVDSECALTVSSAAEEAGTAEFVKSEPAVVSLISVPSGRSSESPSFTTIQKNRYSSPSIFKESKICCTFFILHNFTQIWKLSIEVLEIIVGQTGRSFQTRYKEHITAITKLQNTSTYAEHITNANHTYRDINTDMEILHIQPKSQKLNTLEQCEIYRHTKTHPNDILNTKLNFKTHTLFDSTLRTHPHRKQEAPRPTTTSSEDDRK